MSQLLIQRYLNDIDRARKVAGTSRELVIREAFKDLLKGRARAQNLVFIPELAYETGMKRPVRPDGTILYELRVPHGYWEAKDPDDNLDDEIAKKLRAGYPQSNIIFEDTQTAVLIQDRQEVTRCPMTDVEALGRLLDRFFAWERPEIAEFRKAVEQFKRDLPAVIEALRGKIDAAYAENKPFQTSAAAFLDQARETINPSVSEDDVREMLIQHILTEDIFGHVFNDGAFHRENNIAQALYALEEKFFTGSVKRDTLRALEPYYAAIRANAAQITQHHEKQTFLKVIYENFYKVYNPKAADRLGVVYTPNEIVRFMIEGADWLCHQHFGRTLIDEGVEILDPATGTGTFICEIMEHFRGQPARLAKKYREELHANEVAILPYYVANLNIEATYYGITGQYAEFPNLCFVDTLDNTAALTARKGQQHDLFGGMSQENVARIKRQNERKISVIIGNPPYNAWQESFNNRNANRAYKHIDEAIKDTYIKRGTAQNKNSVYDMYVRFIRWASDRLRDEGIVAFVTNRNFINKAAFDGFRKCVAQEFSEIYVVDLGGDVRENPKLSGTKHNVFGIQTGVTIVFFVRRTKREQSKLFYARRPEFDSAEEKLSWLSASRLSNVNMTRLEPDGAEYWFESEEKGFTGLIPLVTPSKTNDELAIFSRFSLGIEPKTREWLHADDKEELQEKATYFVRAYNESVEQADFPNERIKWHRELVKHARFGRLSNFDASNISKVLMRPFKEVYFYNDTKFISMNFQQAQFFPNGEYNRAICFIGKSGNKDFACLATKNLPEHDLLEKTQTLPRYRYTKSGERLDNITDWGLAQFVSQYGDAPKRRAITRDAVFHYVYGVLHDPVYREIYGQNLKRDFPRIPFQKDFWMWADWGEALMGLHIGYEEVEPWALTRIDVPDERARAAGMSPRVILKADRDNGIITLDAETQLTGIPPEAFLYKLGNRSGLDWILDQYKEKTPRDPTIREKFNTYRFADYKEKVVDLIGRVTRVSVETAAITRVMGEASDLR